MEGLGVGRDDEVIVPTYTFAASAETVLYLGARPVLVDVDPATANVDPGGGRGGDRSADASGRGRPHRRACRRTCRASWRPPATCPSSRTSRTPSRRRSPSLGGRFAGTIGRAGAFSFYATKTITTGEGGMLVTDDAALADRARTMRLHGIGRDAWKRYTAAGTWYYEIEAAGFKDNLTDLAAAIGLAQLERAAELRAARAAIAARYLEGFADLARDGRLIAPRDRAPATSTPGTCSSIRLGEAARPRDAVDLDLPGCRRPAAGASAHGVAPRPRDRRAARGRASGRASTSSRSTSTRSTRGWAIGPASSRPPRPPTRARSACRSGRA